MAKGFWTQARIAELKALWSAGKTAAAIGRALGGISRCAVLGKIFRLRLAPPARGRSTPQPADKAPARRRAGKPQPAPAKARRKTLLDLSNECCRWPYGELGGRHFFFCGAPGADVVRGMPYCAQHMRRAYIVPPSLVKPSLVKPLHQRLAAKLASSHDFTPRSFPRKRESSATDPAWSIFSGFPPARERTGTNKRKFG
ncbi:MAG: GcrA family cell cycle regulator [Xanthobacteraceae bacterium]